MDRRKPERVGLTAKHTVECWNRYHGLRKLYKDLHYYVRENYGRNWREWPAWAGKLLRSTADAARNLKTIAEAAERAQHGIEEGENRRPAG